MAPTTILENDYLSVWYHPRTNIIHHKFRKFVYGERLREGLNTGATLMKRYTAHKWLSDDRDNSAMPPEDVEWCMTDFFPRAIQAGWKHWAVVMPEKVIGQLNMKRFINTYSDMGLNVKVFSNPERALKWLEDQK